LRNLLFANCIILLSILTPLYAPSDSQSQFDHAIRALFAPLLVPVTARSFTDPTDGEVYSIDDTLNWTQPLGKRLCIADIDTRLYNEPHQIMNKYFSWDLLEGGVSPGLLNHYLYGEGDSIIAPITWLIYPSPDPRI
jgi:hypothetical protein